jgi:hypothetical protein
MDDVATLRAQIENCKSYSFRASVTADYGEAVSEFVLLCTSERKDQLKISVLEPDTISGITCEISDTSGKVVFEDKLLAFELLADGLVSPVSAPWFFTKSLRSGYISSCGEKDGNAFVRIDDSYGQLSYSVEVWFDEDFKPASAEIVWEGKRILSMLISDFVIL